MNVWLASPTSYQAICTILEGSVCKSNLFYSNKTAIHKRRRVDTRTQVVTRAKTRGSCYTIAAPPGTSQSHDHPDPDITRDLVSHPIPYSANSSRGHIGQCPPLPTAPYYHNQSHFHLWTCPANPPSTYLIRNTSSQLNFILIHSAVKITITISTKFIHAHQTHFHSGTVGQCSMVSETRYEATARTWSLAPHLRSTQVAFRATFQLVHQSELNGMGFAVVFPIYSVQLWLAVRSENLWKSFNKGKVPT